ncbi:MAG: GIY-YIG nuclease family protein [Rhodospirillales bacterium]
MSGGWVYIMTNRPNGTLYVGVTNDLTRRVWEHREGLVDGFTKKYGLKRLVCAEPQTLVARMEGPLDFGNEPKLGRSFR